MTAGYIGFAASTLVADDAYSVRLLAELMQRLGAAECLQWRLRRQPMGVEDWRGDRRRGHGLDVRDLRATRHARRPAREYGQLLGMLYHGCDDVADVRGTVALGGGSEKDIIDGILTLPAAIAIRDPGHRDLFRTPAHGEDLPAIADRLAGRAARGGGAARPAGRGGDSRGRAAGARPGPAPRPDPAHPRALGDLTVPSGSRRRDRRRRRPGREHARLGSRARGRTRRPVERARFPREKVCGDYVEPRGLASSARWAASSASRQRDPLPITDSAMFVDGEAATAGGSPSTASTRELPPHGYIVPRDGARRRDARRGPIGRRDRPRGDGRSAGSGSMARASRSRPAAGPDGPATGRQICRRRRRGELDRAGAAGSSSTTSATSRSPSARTPRAGRRRRRGGVLLRRALFPGYGWVFPMSGRPRQRRRRHPRRDAARLGRRRSRSSSPTSSSASAPSRPTPASSSPARRSAASSRPTAAPGREPLRRRRAHR